MKIGITTDIFPDENYFEITVGEGTDDAFQLSLTDSDEVSNFLWWLTHEVTSLERENSRLANELRIMRDKLSDLKGEPPF